MNMNQLSIHFVKSNSAVFIALLVIFGTRTAQCYYDSNEILIDSSCPSGCNCSCRKGQVVSVLCSAHFEPTTLHIFRWRCVNTANSTVAMQIKQASLVTIPQEICDMHNLVSLSLDDVNLQTIQPGCFFSSSVSLEILKITNNRYLESLPDGLFDRLHSVQIINFRSNQINYLQSELFLPLIKAKTLKRINFSNNRITALESWPMFFIIFVGLRINLSNNTISTFQSNFNASSQLGKFTQKLMARFSIKKIDANFYLYHNSTYIKNEAKTQVIVNLKHNKIKYVRDLAQGWGFTKFSQAFNNLLTRLDIRLRSNNLVCDCNDYNLYEGLQSKSISSLKKLECANPPHLAGKRVAELLSNLDVFFCELRDRCPANCSCTKRPNKMLTVIVCSKSLQQLPDDLPLRISLNSSDYRYHLKLTNNSIKQLQFRSYLNETQILQADGNNIDSVDLQAWKQMSSAVSIIYLNNNQLTTLPSEVQHVNMSALKEIHLYNNPWRCDCNTLWMQDWIWDLGDAVINRDSILCSSSDIRNGRILVRMDKNMFVCHTLLSTTQYVIIVIPSVAGACLLLIALTIVSIFTKRHWLYSQFNIHPFDCDECESEDMKFDMFMSYANEDEQFIENLVDVLEGQHNFTVCYHKRDFQIGMAALLNIERAIMSSKRTVCYITESFMKSEWCMWEFTMALNLDLENKSRRLIIIKDSHLVVNEVTSLSIKSYLKNYTYIESVPSSSPQSLQDNFLSSFLYALPQRKIKEQIKMLVQLPQQAQA